MKDNFKKQFAGSLGYYGLGVSEKYNKKILKANELVDEYNQNVSSYETIEDQMKYQSEMIKKINKTINQK